MRCFLPSLDGGGCNFARSEERSRRRRRTGHYGRFRILHSCSERAPRGWQEESSYETRVREKVRETYLFQGGGGVIPPERGFARMQFEGVLL